MIESQPDLIEGSKKEDVFLAASNWWIGSHQMLVQSKERRRDMVIVRIHPSCLESCRLRKEAAVQFSYQKGCVGRRKEVEREEIAGFPLGWKIGQKMSVIELGKHPGIRELAGAVASLGCLRARVEALGW